MYLLFVSLAILSLMIALGLFYRISTLLFFLGYSYFFLVERAIYNNHYYLICLLSLMLILAPLNRSWSLDVLRGAVDTYRQAACLVALDLSASYGNCIFLRRDCKV